MEESQQITASQNKSVFPAGFYKTMFWIAGQLGLLAVLILIFGHFGYSSAWDAFTSIDPSGITDAMNKQKIKALKVEVFRNFMLSIGASGAVAVGLFGLGLAAVRTHALNRQAKVAETDSQFSEKKHASEAFATAIEQLGHENFAVQLGAVYALEALAKSSIELHGPIFETLCAYIREKAPAPTDDNLTYKIMNRGDTKIHFVVENHLKAIKKPKVVVQAILTVIGRRDPKRDPEGFRLDLQDTDLRKADMRRAGLHDGQFDLALFNRSYLCGANLRHSHLENTYMVDAHFEQAGLSNADLRDAHLRSCHLECAELDEANLAGAHLGAARLNGTILKDCFFDAETNVSNANFKGARAIPARPGNDFRATVQNADEATWPDDDDEKAWDRGVPDDDAG